MIPGLRPTRIILISFYCFLVGLFLLSLTMNAIFGDEGITDIVLWLPVGAGIILAAVLIAVGIGVLYYLQICWKILFFFLMIYISNVVSLILVFLILLCIDINLIYKYSKFLTINAMTWFSFLASFLSGIIVLYYLTRKEIVSYFGGTGPLIEPF